MPSTIDPASPPLILYAVGAALLLVLVFRIPYAGRVLRALFSFGLLVLCLLLLLQHAPFDPTLARIAARLGLDGQTVSGREVRIRMAPDGHFWARAKVNGVERRMLIDSGATITALSDATARSGAVDHGRGLVPIVLQTANGAIAAETGTLDRLDLGGIVVRRLKVVISPGLGPVDILGMNFLSSLASWRVEGRTLILVPPRPARPPATAKRQTTPT